MNNTERNPVEVSLDTVRTMAIYKQGLDKRPTTEVDKNTVLDAIHKIGLLQLDSIHVVARNHELVMLSRVGLYDTSDLNELLYPDRRLFEQWAHAACLIPIEDYSYFSPVIFARRNQPHRKIGRLGDSAENILNTVMTEVETRGPLTSGDFDDPRTKKTGWWDWKPAKLALEILFEQGYLMIDRRVNFRRYYDLQERILHENIGTSISLQDAKRWVIVQSLNFLGIGTIKQISDYYRQQKIDVQAIIQDLLKENSVVPVKVTGWKESAFLNFNDMQLLEEIESGLHNSSITIFLPPFDNLIWDRSRVSDLFNFDYRVELYTPIATKKRRYGYYVMPILHCGKLVGRLDPKVDRKNKVLIIHSIYLEDNQRITEHFLEDFTHALLEFMTFHDCNAVKIERTDPKKIKGELISLIKKKG